MHYGTYIPKILVIRAPITSAHRSVQVSDNPCSACIILVLLVSPKLLLQPHSLSHSINAFFVYIPWSEISGINNGSALGFCYWNQQFLSIYQPLCLIVSTYWYYFSHFGLYWQYCIGYAILLYSLAQLPIFVLFHDGRRRYNPRLGPQYSYYIDK